MLYGQARVFFQAIHLIVLILIFLENALRHNGNYVKLVVEECVLILIFLENALRRYGSYTDGELLNCLNPYFFGKCSTACSVYLQRYPYGVWCLNPYFFGKCSTAIIKLK